MEVILTHENADFDAVASLWAAYRLFPEAVPVLPRRVNRNCRDFIDLYQLKPPFVPADELPRQRVHHAILVDTQGLTTVKGMGRWTHVHVIDHHELNRKLPAGWTFAGEPMGATTTLLVERMAEGNLEIEPVEATLLLLGIYEDTGNLSYDSTTARDARAAAWLIEHGADLSVADRYIHHPLSQGQHELYERLLEGLTTHEAGGHTVIVARGETDSYDEEISTLAHRLRDLLEPAALFVLVKVKDNVQMVARSTTDRIDVSAIAARFGGGGHSRAAAALVRNRPLTAVYDELVKLLPNAIHSADTVGQIMSRGVQSLTPTTTIAEADERMRRTGHEGYPVVEGAQVLGLLTRRQVDRALRYKMDDALVGEMMQPGNIAVSPSDSIEKLQQLMMNTGWGQIPVVQDGQIVGVVTRTDLINHWGMPSGQPQRRRVDAQLERALPAQTVALVRRIADVAHEMEYNVYFVGGLVRDLLLGAPIFDIDIVVEGDAILLARRLTQRFGGRVVAHASFGTAKWLLEPTVWQEAIGAPPPEPELRSIDFATARTEFYTYPTALPVVERSAIKQDLHRRDFTINTLAIRLDPPHWGELLDFYGGEADLQNKIIRVLHSLSFIDDPTRILRAARLEARLGFHLDPRSEGLIANALPMLSRMSGDRIRHELEQILDEKEPERAICRLDELGLLAHLHPNLRCDRWLMARFRAVRSELDPAVWGLQPADRRLVYLALLLYRLELQPLKEVLERLKMPRAEADEVEMMPELRRTLRSIVFARKASAVYRAFRLYPPRILAVGWLASERGGARARLWRFQTEYRRVEPLLGGDDLKALGLKPGPLFGRLLEALRDARLDGQVKSREDEEALLRRLLKAEGIEIGQEEKRAHSD